MVAIFQRDPSQSATEISPRVGLSVSRMARLFKREMGISIVDYRNDLKMTRFFNLVQNSNQRRPNFLLAALTAGYGSYSQFQRIFRSRWRVGPRDFFERLNTSLSA
jgi:AraC-like DNA-binding protein